MHPILFKIGTFEVRSYGVLLVIGVLIATWMATKRAPRYDIDPKRLWDVVVWIVIVGVLAARLTYIAQEWEYYRDHRAELLSIKFDGLTSFGGVVGGFLAALVWCKRTKTAPLALLDTLAVPFLIGNAIGRVGCLLNGCCFGHPTSLPWAVSVEGAPGLHHPAQVYESFFCLIAAVILVGTERRWRLHRGQSIALAFVLFGLSRFVYEFWRAGTTEQVREGIASSTYLGSFPITQAQVAALAIAGLGIVGAIVFGRRQPLAEVSTA